MTIDNDFAEKLKTIWKINVKKDYKNEWFSYEHDLQASLYMHLRRALGDNYRIYLEQKIDDLNEFRTDIIVCNYEDKPKPPKINCILELKYLPHTHYPNKGLSDMKKLKDIHNYFQKQENKCAIWMEGPHRTDEFSNNDHKKWDDEHWVEHLIGEDTIFGFVLIAPKIKFDDQNINDRINEFLEKDKNYLVLAGKTYITQKGECDFRVLSGK
jgi:hypothetical protein